MWKAPVRALQGMKKIFEAASDIHIICEVSPEMEQELGGNASEIFDLMLTYGFVAFELSNDYTPDGYLQSTAKSPQGIADRPDVRAFQTIGARMRV